ncbi:MAG: N-acyl homoserine lactonase family protein [Myxococcota bacterium]
MHATPIPLLYARSWDGFVYAHLSWVTLLAASPLSSSGTELWRLDCGQIHIPNLAYFSDSFDYEDRSGTVENGCYLIRHGKQYLLWEAGLPGELVGKPSLDEGGWRSELRKTIVGQLHELGLVPESITLLALSHSHGDHIGQAGRFERSTLLLHRREYARIRRSPDSNAHRRLSPWMSGRSKLVKLDGDHDVFGDGQVLLLELPGHTEGHMGLLVRLARAGPILLSGDLYHFHSEVGSGIVSRWNTSRPETLASMGRFERIIRVLSPRVIVQHDPADLYKLPAFPASLD